MEISAEYRRLDSLARLLESNMTCAAVVCIGATLYITTNGSYVVYKNLRKDLNYPLNFMKHLSVIKNEKKTLEEVGTEAINLLLENYKGKKASKYQGKETPDDLLPDDVLKEIIADLLDNTQYWDKINENYFRQKFLQLFSVSDNKFLNMQYISGLYFAYNNLYRDVRDYKKIFHSFSSDGDGYFKDIQDIKLLCIGLEGEHAEMRLLGYLLSNKGLIKFQDGKLIAKNQIYIGISKLCCGDCQRTLNAFNALLTGKIVPLRESERQEKNSKEGAEIMDENEMKQILQTRGTHDLVFKWPEPAFVRGEQYFASESNSAPTCFCIKKGKISEESINAKNEEKLLLLVKGKLKFPEKKIEEKRKTQKINMVSPFSESPPLDEKPPSKSLDSAKKPNLGDVVSAKFNDPRISEVINSKESKKTEHISKNPNPKLPPKETNPTKIEPTQPKKNTNSSGGFFGKIKKTNFTKTNSNPVKKTSN